MFFGIPRVNRDTDSTVACSETHPCVCSLPPPPGINPADYDVADYSHRGRNMSLRGRIRMDRHFEACAAAAAIMQREADVTQMDSELQPRGCSHSADALIFNKNGVVDKDDFRSYVQCSPSYPCGGRISSCSDFVPSDCRLMELGGWNIVSENCHECRRRGRR